MARRTGFALKPGVLWLHKWLGISLALLFAMWFFSGVVMYYVPYPVLTDTERLQATPPLPVVEGCCQPAETVARNAGLVPMQSRLGLHEDQQGSRLVWRILGSKPGSTERPTWAMFDAMTGKPAPELTAEQVGQVAARFSQRSVRQVEALAIDNWTLGGRSLAFQPFYRVEMGPNAQGHDDGLALYVSARAGEVLLDTRRSERFWNWIGTIPHWLYFVPLRVNGWWTDTIIWLSTLGVLMAVTGCVLGVWQLFLNPARRIPYRVFWLRWHHLLGLAAGICTFTWILSGLMSMNPWAVFGERNAAFQSETQRWQGEPAVPVLTASDALAQARQAGFVVKELSTHNIGGQRWFFLRNAESSRWLQDVAIAHPVLLDTLPDELMRSQLTRLRHGQSLPVLRKISQYDHHYYRRHDDADARLWQRPLPVWQARWDDDVLVYADARTGQIKARVDDNRRWQRVLYNGLHSLDFLPLLQRPWLRDGLVVGLSLLGLGLSITGCVIAFQYFQRKHRVRQQRAIRRQKRPLSPLPEQG